MPDIRPTLPVLLAAALAGLVATARAGDVWPVPSLAPNIQIAVNAAAPGDVILVSSGVYNQVVTVDGKGVALVADGAGATLAQLIVRNVPAGETFLLDGFTLDVPDVFAGPDVPLLAEHNPGSLRFQDCTFLGDPGYAGSVPNLVGSYAGTEGATFVDNASVVLHRCTAVGGLGASLFNEDFDANATDGGHGLVCVDSRLTTLDCVLTGAHAGIIDDTVGDPGARGGSGLAASGTSVVQVHGSQLRGGIGGNADCDFFSCGDGGDGGSGLRLSGGAVGVTRDNTYTPGQGGPADPGAQPGDDGQDVLVLSGSSAASYAPAYRSLSAVSPLREGQSSQLTFEGQPGDAVLLLAALDVGQLSLPARAGELLLGGPLILAGVGLGTVTGPPLATPVTVPELGPGLEGLLLTVQPAFVDGAGAWLGPAVSLTLLDAGF